MKIAMVLTRFSYKKLGGVERVVNELSQILSRKGYKICIICRNEYRDKKYEKINSNIEVYRAPLINKKGLKTLSSFIWMIFYIIKCSPDIIHVHDWSPFFPAFFSNLLLRRPLVLHIHNCTYNILKTLKRRNFLLYLYKHIEAFPLKHTKTVLCVSTNLANKIKKFYNIKKVIVIPNGINKIYSKSVRPQKNILFVGSLEERKGIRTFLKAAIKIKNLNFIVVGDGPLYEKLKKSYKKYTHIKFLGRISDTKLKRLYATSEFLVLPSKAEGFGLVWLEAMSFGRPIIGTHTGIAPELVVNPNFGYILHNPDSVDELKEKIILLHKKMERNWTKIESEIKNYITKNFTWNKIVNKLEKIYISLLKTER